MTTATATASSLSTRRLKIGIIGFGPFAQFLAKTRPYSSRSDYSDLCAHLGISFYRSMDELLGLDNYVILLCTSILSLSEVVKSMPFHCLKRPTLFADVLSVKEYPREVLLQAVPEESDILCTYPMFGPESGRDGWRDLAFVYERVRIRNEAIWASFLQIFESEGCRLLEMTCEEHDKLAASFLLTVGRVLTEIEIEHTPIDTKGFEKLVQVTESKMRNSFDLFSGLFIHNKFAKQQLENLELAVQKVKDTLVARMNEGDELK